MILKQRLRKNYRHPDLDHLLTSQRMKEVCEMLYFGGFHSYLYSGSKMLVAMPEGWTERTRSV